MYAREYAKLKNLPYGLVLRLCQEGKIPAIKLQKYLIDPEEADVALAELKTMPKHTPKQRQSIEKREERKTAQACLKKKFNFLEELDRLTQAR